MDLEKSAKEIEVGHHLVECVNVLAGKNSKAGSICRIFQFGVLDGESEGALFLIDFTRGAMEEKRFLARMLIRLGLKGDFDETKSPEYYFNKCAGLRVAIDVHEDSYKNKETGVVTVSNKIKQYTKLQPNELTRIDDIPRLALDEYEPPAEAPETGDGGGGYGGGSYGGDDIPF